MSNVIIRRSSDNIVNIADWISPEFQTLGSLKITTSTKKGYYEAYETSRRIAGDVEYRYRVRDADIWVHPVLDRNTNIIQLPPDSYPTSIPAIAHIPAVHLHTHFWNQAIYKYGNRVWFTSSVGNDYVTLRYYSSTKTFEIWTGGSYNTYGVSYKRLSITWDLDGWLIRHNSLNPVRYYSLLWYRGIKGIWTTIE